MKPITLRYFLLDGSEVRAEFDQPVVELERPGRRCRQRFCRHGIYKRPGPAWSTISERGGSKTRGSRGIRLDGERVEQRTGDSLPSSTLEVGADRLTALFEAEPAPEPGHVESCIPIRETLRPEPPFPSVSA